MNKELKIALLNKQNEVYEILIGKLEKAIPVIEKFDGKMLNVKLNRELEAVDNGIRLRDKNQFLNVSSYNDRHIQWENRIGYSCTHYVGNYDWNIRIEVANKRVVAPGTIETIKKDIEALKERIETNKKSIADYDNMVNDFKAIEKLIKEFKNNYDYNIRSDREFDFGRIL